MRLLIACILIYGFDLPWWMYLIAVGVQIVSLLLKGGE
jgi:hypothetical protein